MASELVIKINGDIKNYEKALEDAQGKTEDLESGLASLAKISAVAFAGLVASIGLSVKAFASQQDATLRLTQSLQNQGIYTDQLVEKYRNIASAVQEKTGLDDDAIVRAQVQIQGLIGQAEVTDRLTFAIADLAEAKKIDLDSSAELIGKGIQGHVAALGKLGIQIDEHLSKEQRTAEILKQVEQRFGGTATAANQGLGSIRGLANAFGDFQENLGAKFAPIIEVVIQKMTQFFTTLSNNKPLLDLLASLLTAGTIVSGLGLAIGTAGIAFLQLKSALEAAKVATSAMTLVTRGLVGATGLGLVLIIASEIYLNWSTIWPRMQQIYEAFANNVGGISDGLGKVLKGIVFFNLDSVKAGLAQMQDTVKKGYADLQKEIKPIDATAGVQDQTKLQNALKANQKEIDDEKRKQAELQAERELAVLKSKDASTQLIQIKTQEVDTLKALEDNKNASIRENLQAHLDQIQSAEVEARAQDIDQRTQYQTDILAQNEQYQALDASQRALFIQNQQTKLQNSLETAKSTKLIYAQQELQEDIKRRNQFLLEEQKFGTAYAAIHAAMNSSIYQGTKNATGDLVQLQNSSNSTLKTIGKAAAITQIGIKTAESAMNIYAGFSAIPIVGPALGAIGAAAAVAYGAEQIGNVIAAEDGGLITGGIPNVDSVPVLAQQGELVVPKQNFEEVVGAVQAQRGVGGEGGGAGYAVIEISLKDELVEFIEAKLIERQRLNISLQGAS